jgi:hypothetical protein
MYRWEEEVELSLEEMCRILCYMDWRVCYWQSCASKRQVSDATVQEGITAYAERQAHIVQALAHSFAQKWLPLLKGYSITPNWPKHYIPSDSDAGMD